MANTFLPSSHFPVAQAIEHILAGLELLLVVFLFCGIGAGIITNLVGFAYPAVATLRSMQPLPAGQAAPTNRVDWKFYWVIYCGLCLLDPLVEGVILYWLPFFHPLKVAFLLWLMLPQTRGANVLSRAVVPVVCGNIDSALKDLISKKSGEGKENSKSK